MGGRGSAFQNSNSATRERLSVRGRMTLGACQASGPARRCGSTARSMIRADRGTRHVDATIPTKRGPSTRYRRHSRRGSCDSRYSHSSPTRPIQRGARLYLPTRKSSDAPTPSATAGRMIVAGAVESRAPASAGRARRRRDRRLAALRARERAAGRIRTVAFNARIVPPDDGDAHLARSASSRRLRRRPARRRADTPSIAAAPRAPGAAPADPSRRPVPAADIREAATTQMSGMPSASDRLTRSYARVNASFDRALTT